MIKQMANDITTLNTVQETIKLDVHAWLSITAVEITLTIPPENTSIILFSPRVCMHIHY